MWYALLRDWFEKGCHLDARHTGVDESCNRVGLYIDNLHSANIARRMMSDGAHLQMNQSSLADVKTFAAQYHDSITGKRYSDLCVENDCLAVISIPDDDFWEKHPKLSN